MVRVFSFSGEVVLNRTEALSLEELSKEARGIGFVGFNLFRIFRNTAQPSW